MNSSIITALRAALLIGLLSSCQTQHRKMQSWLNPEFADYAPGKTAVLAVTDSQSLCLQYESIFVKDLQPYIPAESLTATENLNGKLDKEQLAALLKKDGFKTIIITGLLGSTEQQEILPATYTTMPYSMGYWGYYNYGYTLLVDSATAVTTYVDYRLETAVYEVESGKLVWSGIRTVSDNRSEMHNINQIIKSVIRDLKTCGLLN